MTCTTHHICDCQKERMEKLEMIYRAAKKLMDELRIHSKSDFELPRAIAALEYLK